MVCIQETKLIKISTCIVESLWGSLPPGHEDKLLRLSGVNALGLPGNCI
jgi:hypothetical protein